MFDFDFVTSQRWPESKLNDISILSFNRRRGLRLDRQRGLISAEKHACRAADLGALRWPFKSLRLEQIRRSGIAPCVPIQ